MATAEKTKSILVVDDEEMIGEIVGQLLLYFGFDSVRVTDGAEAIREYKKHLKGGTPFTAVIMDLNMPGGVDGRDAIKELLATDREAKVFVSSGSPDDPVVVNFKEYGVAGVIAKPFDLESMRRALRSLL